MIQSRFRPFLPKVFFSKEINELPPVGGTGGGIGGGNGGGGVGTKKAAVSPEMPGFPWLPRGLVIQNGDTKMAAKMNMDRHPKSGVYRYRKGVPEHLRPYLPEPHTGKRELIFSLRTKNLSDAKRIHIEVAHEAEKLIDHAKREHAKANPQDGAIRINMGHIPLTIPQDDFFISINYGFTPPQDEAPAPASLPITRKAPTTNKGESINAVFDAYVREQNIEEETAFKYRKHWALFCEFSGLTLDHSIKLPTIAMIRDFKRAIVDYPSATTKKMREDGVHKTLEYARKEYANPERTTKFTPISPKTLKQYLAAISAVLKYAVRNGDREDDPTSSGICKIRIDTEETRPAYTLADLKGIFAHPAFREPTWNHRQWLPAIALYTGARSGEIGNMLVEDVKQVDGIWYFHIRKTNDAGKVVKRVKNKSSVRQVPIHRHLIELGFLKHYEAVKEAGETRLFPTYTSAQYFSTWWGEQREVMGITNADKVFHSFRHTFRDAIRRHKIDREIGKRLMGHASKDVHDSYGDGHEVATLKEWLDRITFDVDIPKPN